jgi:hypothetical protein
METGILYVVFNESIRNPETNELLYKIGITKKAVYDRYYGLGLKMPGTFKTLFAYKLEDYAKAEQIIQGILKKYRENGEWFNIGQKELDHIKSTCELMGGLLVTDAITGTIGGSTPEPSLNQVHPNFPCKVIVFNIKNSLLGLNGFLKRPPYEATRKYWRIEEKYRNYNVYEFAVGLVDGVAETAYKIKKWFPTKENEYVGRYEFDGEETEEIYELCGFIWKKQIDLCKGYYGFGNYLVVEFDGKDKFCLIRPQKNNWFDC